MGCQAVGGTFHWWTNPDGQSNNANLLTSIDHPNLGLFAMYWVPNGRSCSVLLGFLLPLLRIRTDLKCCQVWFFRLIYQQINMFVCFLSATCGLCGFSDYCSSGARYLAFDYVERLSLEDQDCCSCWPLDGTSVVAIDFASHFAMIHWWYLVSDVIGGFLSPLPHWKCTGEALVVASSIKHFPNMLLQLLDQIQPCQEAGDPEMAGVGNHGPEIIADLIIQRPSDVSESEIGTVHLWTWGSWKNLQFFSGYFMDLKRETSKPANLVYVCVVQQKQDMYQIWSVKCANRERERELSGYASEAIDLFSWQLYRCPAPVDGHQVGCRSASGAFVTGEVLVCHGDTTQVVPCETLVTSPSSLWCLWRPLGTNLQEPVPDSHGRPTGEEWQRSGLMKASGNDSSH